MIFMLTVGPVTSYGHLTFTSHSAAVAYKSYSEALDVFSATLFVTVVCYFYSLPMPGQFNFDLHFVEEVSYLLKL